MKTLSVFVPVRRDCPWIKGLTDSLIRNASDASKIEIFLGIDHNDRTTRIFHPSVYTIVLDKRAQKDGLMDYSNRMAELSHGKWMWELADDYLMKTQNFDLLFPEDKWNKVYRIHPNPTNGGNLYMSFSRGMYETLGRMKGHASAESWINFVFDKLSQDRNIHLDDLFIEDRRITGDIPGEMFKWIEPEISINVVQWDSPEMYAIIDKDAALIEAAFARGL